MNASERIVKEFNRLVAIGQERIPERPFAEQVVFFMVATRCAIDIDGFESVYEQAFKPPELMILIEGLHAIGETRLATEFAYGLELLQRDGFYVHLNYNRLSPSVKKRLSEIGDTIGDQLWELDEKLVALLDSAPADRNID